MNTEPENFEQLRKLLALKKHEQPPPGYFNNLPNQIWTRIEKEKASPAPTFLEELLSRFVLRPTVAYGFAFIVCATLIVGIGSTLNQEDQLIGGGTPTVQQQNREGLTPGTPALAREMELPHTNISSTNPVPPSPSSLLHVQPVTFNP
ncbi:MAG: hypothetical protein H0X66_07110 [Verrucomicrobia bacterium]|nr:hypothetical protein [Verrucomicrobiota bacterium]